VVGAETTNKSFSIKDFAVYMNFSENSRDVLFEELTKSWPETGDAKYMRFLNEQCNFSSKEQNNYII
jgi:hypothetical protein